jgi:DNA-binding FadR family transcriptional regulator
MSDPDDAAELKLHSDAGHRAILRGLQEGDPVAAAAAASAHVAYTEYWVKKNSGSA